MTVFGARSLLAKAHYVALIGIGVYTALALLLTIEPIQRQ